jgi:hypothetical protein
MARLKSVTEPLIVSGSARMPDTKKSVHHKNEVLSQVSRHSSLAAPMSAKPPAERRFSSGLIHKAVASYLTMPAPFRSFCTSQWIH